MSVHVHGGPISIHQNKTVVLSDVEALRKEELERRRKLRLEQVRHQSKEFSKSILHKVQIEKEKNKENEQKEKEMELRKWQVERIKSLEQQYQDCLDSVRQNQDDKSKISEEEMRKQKLLLEKENLRKARERGKQAMEKLKTERQAEESKKEGEQKQKNFKNTIEKLRSTLVTSRDVLKDISTNNAASSSLPPSSDLIESRTDQHVPCEALTTSQSGRQYDTIRTGQPVASEGLPSSQGRQFDAWEIRNGQNAASEVRATSQLGKAYDRNLYAGHASSAGRERVEVNLNSSKKTTNKTELNPTRNPQSDTQAKFQENTPVGAQADRRATQPERHTTREEENSIIQTLASERQKLLEYKLKLENEERKRQLLEEKLRMEQQTRLNELLREENERLKRNKEKRDTRSVLEEMRGEDSERQDQDEEEERKLEEYRRELARLRQMRSKEEGRGKGGRGRDKELRVNIITSGRRSKSCRGSRRDSCLGHSSTESDESFLSDKTWPPSQVNLHEEDLTSPEVTTRGKCNKCTSKKLSHPPAGPPKSTLKPSTTQRTKPKPPDPPSGGVFDRNLRAFEKERLGKDFKKLLGELEHLSREERRIKSRGCLLHDDPIFHMSETRKQAAAQLKQNKMASAFEQLSAGFNLNHLGAETQPESRNFVSSRDVKAGDLSNGYPPNKDPSQIGNIGTGTVQPQDETDNMAKLKQLLDRVNQKREIIMKEIMNPRHQTEARPNHFADLHTRPVNSRVPNADGYNQRFDVDFAEKYLTGNVRFAQSTQSEVEKEFERILLNQTAQQTMVSKEIQVSPRIDGSGLNHIVSNESRLNHSHSSSKSTTSSPAGLNKTQTAVWTHVDTENGQYHVHFNNEIDRKDAVSSPSRPYINDGNVLNHKHLVKSSMQQVVMHSQEVQTSLEYRTETNHTQQIEDPHNTSTWAEDLQVQSPSPRKASRVTNALQLTGASEARASPNAHVRRTISQQSEITTIKAAQRHETNAGTSPMALNQYVYQVETTSSTTEIEVSNLETVYDDRRSKRKKHRSGKNNRKSTVAFPPSPIAKVRQVRKTLFNNNIEVIVNIKDDLLDDVARGNLSDEGIIEERFGPSRQYNEQELKQRPNLSYDDQIENRQLGSIEDRNRQLGFIENQHLRQPCFYYQDERRPDTQHYPSTHGASKWQHCRGQCQSNTCRCFEDREEISTDETRSSYLSPPRSMKTLHQKEINNLISQHSLHGNVIQAENVDNFTQGKGNRREQMEVQEYNEPNENVEPKPGKPKRKKQLPDTFESNINNEMLDVINEKLKYDNQGNPYQAEYSNTINDGKENIKKKPKKPVEIVPQNQDLMKYIVTLLNMDKKEIAGIPIEVSDVSIASELFSSTSEQSDQASDTDKGRRERDNISYKPTDVNTKPGIYERVENGIDVGSRRNQNILAQKYTDIMNQKGKNHDRDGHLRANDICTKTGHLPISRMPTNIDTQRFEEYRLGEGFVKRPCNANVCKASTKPTTNVPYITNAEITGRSNLAQSIANAGSKLPYKEIFKSNILQESAIQNKYKALAPLLNCRELPSRKADVPLQYHLNKKVEGYNRDENQHQTNFDVQPHKRKASKVPAGFDQLDIAQNIKHQQPSSRSGKEKQNDRKKQTVIIRENYPRCPPRNPNVKQTREGQLTTKNDVQDTNKPRDLRTKQHNHLKPTPAPGQTRPTNINSSVQTTAQSGDESTVYLNIPRQFQNVDDVGVQERRNQSLDTSDLIRELNKNGTTDRNALTSNKWKVIHEILTSKKRRPDLVDICAGVGVETDPDDKTKRVMNGTVEDLFDERRKRNEQFNGSMDLQAPDVRLERPLSQQNSERKSPSDNLNSPNASHHPAPVPHQHDTCSTGWNNVDSLVQELIRRNIIDRPFPWLTAEPGGSHDQSGGLDETNLTEMLRRLLESDTGSSSDKTPPIADARKISQEATTTSDYLERIAQNPPTDPMQKQNHPSNRDKSTAEDLRLPMTQGSTSITSPQNKNPIPNQSTSNETPCSKRSVRTTLAQSQCTSNRTSILNRTTDSMRQRKTDLMSIFEDYKRDIDALLNVMPSPESAVQPPPCDLDTFDHFISPLDSEQTTNQTSPTDLDNPLLQETSETRDTSNNSNLEATPVPVSSLQQENDMESNKPKKSSLIKSDEGIGTSTNRTNKENGSSQPKSDEENRETPKRTQKDRNVQPMTSEEFIQQLKALTVTSDQVNKRRHKDADSSLDKDGMSKKVDKDTDISSENIAVSGLNEDADIAKTKEGTPTKVAKSKGTEKTTVNDKQGEVSRDPNGSSDNIDFTKAYDNIPNLDEYQALSAQLTQIVRDNESLNAEWNQLLSGASVDSSSEDIEKRLAAIVQSVDSGRSGSGTAWMGTTYKTLRQRQRDMLDSSATTSPEEARKPPPRGRKPRRVSPRCAPGDTFRSLHDMMNSTENEEAEKLNISRGGVENQDKIKDGNEFQNESTNRNIGKNLDHSFSDFKQLNESIGSLGDTTGEQLSMNYANFLRERDIALGNESGKRNHQSLEHQAHFDFPSDPPQTTPDNPPSNHPRGTESSKKYTSSTPVKKTGPKPTTGPDASAPLKLCLCIPCTLCEPSPASCEHAFMCKLCCHDNKIVRDVTKEPRLNSELSGIVRPSRNEIGSPREISSIDDDVSL